MMFKKSERGFTLIELLAVVAILGVLAGVAVPRVLGALDNSKRTANITNRAILQSAVDRYYVDKALYPTSANGDTSLPSGTNVAALNETALATYLSGSKLPAIVKVNMSTSGTDTIVDPAAHQWGLNSTGQVVIINTAATQQIWAP